MLNNTNKNQPMVSVIVPTHNRVQKLYNLLNSLILSHYPKDKLEIIVIDDASSERVSYKINKIKKIFPSIKIIRSEKEILPSFSRNIGALLSRGKFIFFIDDDNLVNKYTIVHIVSFMNKYPNYGIVGPVSLYLKNTNLIWSAGGFIRRPFYRHFHLCKNKTLEECKILTKKIVIDCDYVPNAYMVRSEIFRAINGFDFVFFPIGMEEVDLALKIKKLGYKIGVLTLAKVFHDVPVSKDVHITPKRVYHRGRSRILFYLKNDKIRASLILFDAIYFLTSLLKTINKDNLNHYSVVIDLFKSYIKGIYDGFIFYIKFNLAKLYSINILGEELFKIKVKGDIIIEH